MPTRLYASTEDTARRASAPSVAAPRALDDLKGWRPTAGQGLGLLAGGTLVLLGIGMLGLRLHGRHRDVS